MSKPTLKELGPPDFEVAGLRIWIRGRELENATDYWDGNWLRVTARCGSAGAEVWAEGPILHLAELQGWLAQLKELERTLNGCAELSCMEPNLSARLELTDGRGELVVNITPDHLAEKHGFTFAIDQSYLQELASALERVLERLPIRGKPS
jgi:hypothetical protein